MLILNFIFQGWPETVALLFLSFAIVDYRPKLFESISYSLLLVSIIYLFRILPVPFGLHTIVGILALVIVIYKKTKVSLGISFFASFSTFFILVCLETFFQLLIRKIVGNIPLQGWISIVVGWPQVFCLAGATIVVRKIRPTIMKKRWSNE